MIAFLRRRIFNPRPQSLPQPAMSAKAQQRESKARQREKRLSKWQSRLNGEVRGTPAALLETAEMFFRKGLYDECQQVADLAIMMLLRLHYVAAAKKFCTSCTDVESLLQKLLVRGAISDEQYRHACELFREAEAENDKKKAKKTLMIGHYLSGILRSETLDAPMYYAEIRKGGNFVQRTMQSRDRSIVEGFVTAFTEAAPKGLCFDAKVCTESQSV